MGRYDVWVAWRVELVAIASKISDRNRKSCDTDRRLHLDHLLLWYSYIARLSFGSVARRPLLTVTYLQFRIDDVSGSLISPGARL
jgi:hypothetical protein